MMQGEGVFPPNTLFRLKEVQEPPFQAEVIELSDGNTGDVVGRRTVQVQQRCYVVAATFQDPNVGASASNSAQGAKMATPVTTLQYGNRDFYITGVHDVTHKPPLTMAEEFT